MESLQQLHSALRKKVRSLRYQYNMVRSTPRQHNQRGSARIARLRAKHLHRLLTLIVPLDRALHAVLQLNQNSARQVGYIAKIEAAVRRIQAAVEMDVGLGRMNSLPDIEDLPLPLVVETELVVGPSVNQRRHALLDQRDTRRTQAPELRAQFVASLSPEQRALFRQMLDLQLWPSACAMESWLAVTGAD